TNYQKNSKEKDLYPKEFTQKGDSQGVNLEETYFLLSLHRESYHSTFSWRKIWERYPSLTDFYKSNSKEWKGWLKEKEIQKIQESQSKIQKGKEIFESLLEKNISILSFWDPHYPSLLREIYAPPLLLFYQGRIEILENLCISIVGARRASFYGKLQAQRFSRELSLLGFTITSGMALGIDTEVHWSCLSTGGNTIAVLGSGFDVIYPRKNKNLFQEICLKGLVITEYFPETKPLGYHFPWRNRIISGLSLGTLIIEGSIKSGSLITAKWAMEQNREVFALPGPVDSPTSHGPHYLIHQGAKLVENLDHILEEFSSIDPFLFSTNNRTSSKVTDIERKIMEFLKRTERDVEEIEEKLALPIYKVWKELFRLEMEGKIFRIGDKFAIHPSYKPIYS
ncbi:MAG: DNA-protecting protein DprA, partial [Planctomycetota bacterium]